MTNDSGSVLAAVVVLTCIIFLIVGWSYKPETEIDKKALPVVQAILFWFFVMFWGAADVYLMRPELKIWMHRAECLLATVGQLYMQGLGS